MYPTIHIGGAEIPTFSLCVIAGFTAFTLIVIFSLLKKQDSTAELWYILPKIFISFGGALIGAIFFDALFKIPENGGFKISGITFYGGAITGIFTLWILLSIFKKHTRLSVMQWLNFLIVPFTVFHFCGRIGCFLGGCCYGKPTQSFWGIYFPDNPQAGIFHYGQKVYPTQLFEAAAIALIAIITASAKHKYAVYCIAYPSARFLLEFLRGDDRGNYLGILSPSQFVSIIILIFTVAVIFLDYIKNRKNNRPLYTQ